jgi:hypothetical protein
MFAKSIIDSVDPRRVMPISEKVELRRANCRSDTEEPT